jgi:hypothetical protein
MKGYYRQIRYLSGLLLLTLFIGLPSSNNESVAPYFENHLNQDPIKDVPVLNPSETSFTPVIDGRMTSEEHWELAENIHTTFLHTDSNHIDNYNYVYTARKNGKLYILVDLCSDTTDDWDQGEWISIWLDTDSSKTYHNYSIIGDVISEEELVNELAENFKNNITTYQTEFLSASGAEGIFYNTSSDESFLSYLWLDGMTCFNSTANYTVAYDFNTSVNFAVPHRVYEFEINLSDLNSMNSVSDYGVLVQGYGTLSISDDYAAYYTLGLGSENAYFSQILSRLWYADEIDYVDPLYDLTQLEITTYSLLLGASQERFYFPCGLSSSIKDLRDNSALFSPLTTNTFCQPVIDGFFSPTEGWEHAENIHTAFLHVDDAHQDTYNFIYSYRNEDYLYVLLDLCSDITDDAQQGEWISLWLDNTYSPGDPCTYVPLYPQYGIDCASMLLDEFQASIDTPMDRLFTMMSDDDGVEGIFYNVTDGNTSIIFPTNEGELILNSTADFTVSYNFSTSPNSQNAHRIYEFQIRLDELSYFDRTCEFGLLVQGYGTMQQPTIMQPYEESGFYGLGHDSDSIALAQLTSWIYFQGDSLDETGEHFPNSAVTTNAMLLLASLQGFYFPMGPSATDLRHNPSMFAVPDDNIDWQRQLLENEESSTSSTVLWNDGIRIYSACDDASGEVNLTCWDQNGSIIWSDLWLYDTFNNIVRDIWGDNESIFVATTKKITIFSPTYFQYNEMWVLKWALNGTFLGIYKFSLTAGDDESKVITGDSQYLYGFGHSYGNSTSNYFLAPQLICWDKNTFEVLWNLTINDFSGYGQGICLDGAGNVILYGLKEGEYGDNHFIAKYNLSSRERVWIEYIGGPDGYNAARSVYLINDTIYIFAPTEMTDGILLFFLNATSGMYYGYKFVEIPKFVYMNRVYYYNGFFFLDTGIEQTKGFDLSSGTKRLYDISPTIRHTILKIDLDGNVIGSWAYRTSQIYEAWYPGGITICNNEVYSITKIQKAIAVRFGSLNYIVLLKWKFAPIEYPPPAPVLITQSQTIQTESLNLAWNLISDVSLYRIFINGTFAGNTTNTNYTLNLGGNGTYIITVTAVNSSGESNQSLPINITVLIPPIINPPGSPVLLTANQTITTDSLLLSWNTTEGATVYLIYINGVLNQTVTNTSIILYFPTNGTYLITIVAGNDDGLSEPSETLEIQVAIPPIPAEELPTKPPPPIALVVTVGGVAAVAGVGLGTQVSNVPHLLKEVLKNNQAPGDIQKPSDISNSPSIEPLNVPVANQTRLIDQLGQIWNKMPNNLKKLIYKSVDRYLHFKAEAELFTLAKFTALSTEFLTALQVYRAANPHQAIEKLTTVKVDAKTVQFNELAGEAELSELEISQSVQKGGK